MKKIFLTGLILLTCVSLAFATVTSSTSKNDYVGNGAVDTYSYTFRIFVNTDLVVTVADTDNVETELTLTTDYTVTGAGAVAGGTVVLVDSSQAWLDGDGDLLTGYALNIRRVRPLTQETDIRNQGDFFPEVHEDTFDHLLMVSQQLQEELNRSVKTSVTSGATIVFPTPVDGYVNVWSGTGGSMVTAAYSTTALNSAVSDAETAQTAAELAETNAQTAQTAAELAETNAAASEAAAAASAASIDGSIYDDDGDTYLDLQRGADDDTIRFGVAGVDMASFDSAGFMFTTNSTSFIITDGSLDTFKIDDNGMQLTTSTQVNAIFDEDTMVSDSTTALATQQSIKAYVDAEIGAITVTSDLERISTTTITNATNSAAISIAQGVKYRVVINLKSTTATQPTITLRFNEDSNLHYGNSGEVLTTSAEIDIISALLNNSGGIVSGSFDLMTVFTDRMAVSGKVVGFDNAGNVLNSNITGIWDNSDTVTSFKILTVANVTGTIILYKYNES